MALFIFFAVFFICFDRYLKYIALHTNINFNILGNILRFNFAPNYNIAFSLPLGGLFLNILIPVIMVGLVFFIIRMIKTRELLDTVAMLIIIFGALSNYADRLLYGYVVDYFDLKYFTVFNVADAMIVLGVGIIIINGYKRDYLRKIKS